MSIASEAVARQIKHGVYDHDIKKIAKEASQRLKTIREAQTTAKFGMGDAVEINSLCGTQYLHGQRGVVVGKSRVRLKVQLDEPTGRFVRYIDGKAHSTPINVPPSIVDRVE
jgi:hypothetical protein